jgi:predicted nucleic acid-binding protein
MPKNSDARSHSSPVRGFELRCDEPETLAAPTGPLRAADEALARRYRAILESWQTIELDLDIAENAARLRASLRLKLADAIPTASALAIDAAALVTHDRDFSRLRSLRIIS